MSQISNETTTVPFSKVDREGRARIDYPDIEELADSLYKQGFIHPLSINQQGTLIAGGRRSAALDHLFANPETYPYDSAHPDMRGLLRTGQLHVGVHFSLKITKSEDHLRELELIENVQRQNFTWQEECIAVARIHRLKQRDAILSKDQWGQRETGKLLKCSAASVNYCLKVADKLNNDSDSPLWQASNMTEAIQLLASNKFDEAQKLLVEKAKERASTLPNIQPTEGGSDFFSTFNPSADEGDHINNTVQNKSAGSTPTIDDIQESSSVSEHDQAIALASKLVYNMNCTDFFDKVGEGVVDHVICDPPYGIDMKNLAQTNTGQNDIDRIADTHDVDDNMGNFRDWLEGCYKIMKDTGFCIWWCDITQFEFIKSLAKEVGFKVQNWQLTWVKTSNCMNQRAEYNFTKNTEIAIVMRKGDARLLSAQQSSVWSGALTPEDKETFAKHPFIKPDPLWAWLLDAVALPGSTICDPFSGVGSSTLAAFKRGYQVLNCEIDEAHYNQQIGNLGKLIRNMSK